jgi:hypothetical protein
MFASNHRFFSPASLMGLISSAPNFRMHRKGQEAVAKWFEIAHESPLSPFGDHAGIAPRGHSFSQRLRAGAVRRGDSPATTPWVYCEGPVARLGGEEEFAPVLSDPAAEAAYAKLAAMRVALRSRNQ